MPKKQCIGKTFSVGSYSVTVEDVIAEGGFALVFLTKDQMGRRFALKRMYVNTEQDVVMCQQEIHILETLGKEPDSSIVRFLASTINVIDEEVKEVLILLDYYKYSVLQLMNDRFQAKRHLTEEEILNIFADVCHAVGKLHTQRPAWAHRDLKVENILIDKDGRCVLCDFGSCTTRTLDPLKQSITDIEEDLKKYTTIAYRAPEMVNLYGFKKPVTIKADIWALGVMLYKLSYFTLPFGESPLAIQNCNLQFPSTPGYSKHLTGLIRYCLRVNPDERPEIYQVAALTCSLLSRDCLVPNTNRCPQPSPDLLLTIPEISQVAPNLFTETSPPRTVRPPTIPSQEFSSTTSIAPRERPKASSANPSGNLIVLAGSVNLKLANGVAVPLASSQPLGSADQSQRKNSMSNSRPGNGGFGGENVDQVFSGSPFKPVAGAVNPFRPSGEVGNSDWVTPFPRPEVPKPRMGHRRNTSDTSMVPATRPLSPTPTQNISEKSRSADTSPHRSPLHPGGDVEKKFSNWNPFDDSEVWAHLPAPPTISSAGLAQSISSLVRGGSISSASRTTLASPTGESGDKVKAKSGRTAPGTDGKKEKKKFRYQKFDNDSEEELMEADGDADILEEFAAVAAKRQKEQKEKVKDKDTDSIGSASDLKHEDDTTDDERHGDQPGGVAVQVHPADPEKTEEEDNTAFDCVQYGTLEETVSAIVSGSNQSILQETSNKPLLEMGFDKSDDDELESRGNATTHLPQRRLTFEGMGLLSVFDQIPFRYSKKSKGIASKVSEVQNTPRLIDEASFAETNPFLSSFPRATASHHQTSLLHTDSSKDFENIAGRFTDNSAIPPKLPPPVPPKPTFLRKDGNHNGTPHSVTAKSGNQIEPVDVFAVFDVPSYREKVTDVFHTQTVRMGSTSPVVPENTPLFNVNSVSGSPKLSKSPSRRSRRLQEGISNVSFEDG